MFRLCGCIGLTLAVAFSIWLTRQQGSSYLVMASTIALTLVVFLALAIATKIVVGHETLVYYRQEIAILAGTALLLRLFHQPVLPYLDITVLGLGLFLTFGRIGCLLVGCCHGRPFRWGICYTKEHAAAGFTPYYVGIPLFPVQALESFWALTIVSIGTSMILRGSPPGSALTWYIIAYGLGRFCLEFLRGDPDRPYFCGFSEAQWTSLVLMSLTVYGQASRVLPLQPWHIAVTALVAVTMVALAIYRRFRRIPTFLLFHPQHVRDVAEALMTPGPGLDEQSKIYVFRTSLGIKISKSEIGGLRERVSHYTLSCADGAMTSEVASEIAKVISLLRHGRANVDLVAGNSGTFHVFCTTRPENNRA